MPLITIPIQPQAFEICRNRIAEILTDEIPNQYFLTYDPDLSDVEVIIEANSPHDQTSIPLVNVSFASDVFSNKDYKANVKGTAVYNIDVYSNSPSTDEEGDKLAAVKLQRIMGVCRSILENPIYKTLGYAAGFINRVYCQDMHIGQSRTQNDANNSCMGRIQFTVEAQETTSLIVPNLIEGYQTTLKLDVSEKGYFYTSGV